MQKRSMDALSQAHDLFNFLLDRNGATVTQMARYLKVSRPAVRRRIHALRKTFADDPGVGLVCDPQGMREEHVYRFVDNQADGGRWITGRINDAHSRIDTIYAVQHSIMLSTDGRSIDGKRARAFVRHLGRLQEDLSELAEV